MIRFVRGNLFDSSAPVLVNTVNCVGIMGKGIAYQFKRAHPAYFLDYEKRCKRNEVRIGEVYSFHDTRIIISFPTKQHWRSLSKLQDVDAGLIALRDLLQREGLTHVAVPPLGCGNGGLSWADVRPLIESRLADLPGIEVEVYEPTGEFEARVAEEPRVSLGHFVLAALRVGLANPNRLAIQKAAYMFNVYAETEYFRFTEYKFGPYCAAIEPMFSVIRDYLDFTKLTAAEMVNDGIQRRLPGPEGERLRRWEPAILRAQNFCNRHSGDVEALATAHAVLARSGPLSLQDATDQFLAWSKEKAERFTPIDVERAIHILEEEQLVEKTLLGFSVRQPSLPTRPVATVGLTLPADLAADLREIASRTGLTLDGLLRSLVDQYLAEHGKAATASALRAR